MNIKTKFVSGINNVKYFYVKNKPQILLGAGLTAGAGCVGLAVWGTIKAVKDYNKARNDDAAIVAAYESHDEETYSEKQYKKDRRKNKLKAIGKTALDYAPAVAVGALAVVATVGSHNEMQKRNDSANAFAKMMKDSYDKLADAVKRKYGATALDDLTGATEEDPITVEEVNKETGELEKVERKVMHGELQGFQRYFSESKFYISTMPDANECTIAQCRRTCNNELNMKRFLTFNEALDIFGFPSVAAGITNGWVKGSENGDNEVRVEVTEIRKPMKMIDGTNDFIKDYLLTFNLDGDITKSAEKVLPTV